MTVTRDSDNKHAADAYKKCGMLAGQVGWVAPATLKSTCWRLRSRPSVLDLEGPSVLKQVLQHALDDPSAATFSRYTTDESTHCDFESTSYNSASSRSSSPERKADTTLLAGRSEEAQKIVLTASQVFQQLSVGRVPSVASSKATSSCLPQVSNRALHFCCRSQRLLVDSPQLVAHPGPWRIQTQSDEVCRQGHKSVVAGQANRRSTSDTSAEAPAMDLVGKELRGSLTQAKAAIASLGGSKALPNQDRASMIRLANGAEMLAVFDGHGEDGHLVADFCAEHLPEVLLEGLARQVRGVTGRELQPEDVVSSWKESTKAAFATMQDVLEEATVMHMTASESEYMETLPRLDASCSGTTATVALLQSDGSALLAHVGDSKAVIGTRQRCTSMFQKNPWQTRNLTMDHKPKLQAERQRILEAGAVVVSSSSGTQRILSRGQFWPAINMTRSLGDLHNHTQGVTSTPTVTFEPQLWNPSNEEAIMIIASDGLWDVMTPEECVQLAAAFPPSEAASALAKEALSRWKRNARRCRSSPDSDDITVVVKFL
mmetsp:Transcript_139/g.417  ORF Transcript_139/g.417 Transcript_139/m.417 type:complete len:544 (+) Transcript_139:64-1695(+)